MLAVGRLSVLGQAMHVDLAELTTADFLAQLAARTSAPAGGVVAAFQAAQAAALVAMVARFTDRGEGTEADQVATRTVVAAEQLRERAQSLASEDMEVFAKVRAAWSLPAGAEREQRIHEGLAEAAGPPAAIIAVARELVDLAEQLLPTVNASVAADLAAGVDAVGAAVSTSRRNVEADLAGNPAHPLREQLADVDDLLARAVDIGDVVRRGFRS